MIRIHMKTIESTFKMYVCIIFLVSWHLLFHKDSVACDPPPRIAEAISKIIHLISY